MTQRRWDIFCKIVDNYGDIGICWRLAQQLSHVLSHIQVRLFVDNDATVGQIIPQFLYDTPSQLIHKVEVCDWKLAAQASVDVVLETFGCGLPVAYLKSMQTTKPVWINLEYLSAEPWVEDFHAKPSLHPSLGLNKHFYFPGFTPNTGGLIREQGLLEERDTFLAQKKVANDGLKISLFCYPQAPIKSLLIALQQLSENNQKIKLYIPFNKALLDIFDNYRDFFGYFNYKIGEVYQNKNLTISVLPFLSQDEYDQLLWQCDLNFVRGEDSWVRAIWAGKPFIWQPYIQTDDTHIQKLNAFLQTHFAQSNVRLQSVIANASTAWSTEHADSKALQAIWLALFNNLPEFQQYCHQQTARLVNQTSLVHQLVAFSENLLKIKV